MTAFSADAARRALHPSPGARPEMPAAPPPPMRYRPDPGHGPGVATSGSSSTFVSKSRKPRRR